MSPEAARARELFTGAEGSSAFLKLAYNYFGRAGWNRDFRRPMGAGGDTGGPGGFPGEFSGAGGGTAPGGSGEPGGATGEATGELPWWATAAEKAAPWLTGVAAAGAGASALQGYRGAGLTGMGVGLAGHTSPEALSAARASARAGNTGMDTMRTVREAEQVAKSTAPAAKATWWSKGKDALGKIPGAGVAGKVGSKFLPGLNVVGSGYGLGSDIYDLAKGKEYEAPESGWGMAGQMLQEGLTPLGDIGAGATVGAAVGGPAGALIGGVVGGGARAVTNVGRVVAEGANAGGAVWDAWRSGGYGNKGKVEDSELEAFKQRKKQRADSRGSTANSVGATKQ